MPDYTTGKIYCIRCYDNSDVYYGSTTEALCERMAKHRNGYKRYLQGNYGNTTSNVILQYGSAYIELCENYACNSKEELNAREGDWIRNNPCVNKRIEGRTTKEYYEEKKNDPVFKQARQDYRDTHKSETAIANKQYREQNADSVADYQKQYQQQNKEDISQKKKLYYEQNKEKWSTKGKERITCVNCGANVARGSLHKHKGSKRCQQHSHS